MSHGGVLGAGTCVLRCHELRGRQVEVRHAFGVLRVVLAARRAALRAGSRHLACGARVGARVQLRRSLARRGRNHHVVEVLVGRTGRQRLHARELLRSAALVRLRLVLLVLMQLRYLLLEAHLLRLAVWQADVEALVI